MIKMLRLYVIIGIKYPLIYYRFNIQLLVIFIILNIHSTIFS